MLVEVIDKATWPAVPVDAVKASQRIMHAQEDALIERSIRAATLFLERENQIAITARTLRVSIPSFPSRLELPAPPLRYTTTPASAVSVSRMVEGVMIASPGLYHVVREPQVWALVRTAAALPADIDADHPAAFQATVDVGYASASEVPEDIQSAIILLAGHFYQNREAVIIEQRVLTVPRNLELGVESLMKHYRVRTRYVPAWAA